MTKRLRIWKNFLPTLLLTSLMSGCRWLVPSNFDHYSNENRMDRAEELLEIAAEGLERFRDANGRYPLIDGKYFFDSIKVYIEEDVRADMFRFVFLTEKDRFGRVETMVGNPSSDALFTYDSCYLAVWDHRSYVSYKQPKPGEKHLLYWVGLNWRDDGGTGDDMVHEDRASRTQ